MDDQNIERQVSGFKQRHITQITYNPEIVSLSLSQNSINAPMTGMLCLPQLSDLHFISLPTVKLEKHFIFQTLKTLQHRHIAMASTPPKPSKQLGELLRENQEPFTLELYLSERGCLKKPASCCLNKNRRGFPRCSKTLRAVYKKFVSIKEGQRVKSSENRNDEVEESDRFSSASSTTVFNSCSESDKEEISSFDAETVQALKLCNIREKQAATGRKLWWRRMEDSKQLSPVSVLEEIPSHEVQQNARIRQKESYTGVAELQGLGELHLSPQFLKSKRVLQQTKQLLFDCVREVVESHAKNERGKQHEKKFLGPEELGKLVCERITSWGKQAGDETNTNYFLDSEEEWCAFKQQKREIEYEIGDTILEEIKNEIVTEMFDDFLVPTRC